MAPVAGLERAFARVGGHPLLLRLWLHEAASEGVTPAEVGEWSVVRGHLLSLRRMNTIRHLDAEARHRLRAEKSRPVLARIEPGATPAEPPSGKVLLPCRLVVRESTAPAAG